MASQSTEPRRLGLEINRKYFGTGSNYTPPAPDKLLNNIFCNCKKVAVLNVAVEEVGCCVRQHSVIAQASLSRMFN